MTSSLFDICFNFAHQSFRHDEQAVLQRALDAGVESMMITGSTLDDSEKCIELCQLAPAHLFATAGVHPHYASGWDDHSGDRLRAMLAHPCVRAAGECGLDYNREYSSRQEQKSAFRAQLEIAIELKLPVFLHEREAHRDMVDILGRYLPDLDAAVVHCFTGTREELERYLAMGLHIGITGWVCDERRGRELAGMVELIPQGKLMLETDAPYLLPRDLKPKPKGRRNEPAMLEHICAVVAGLRAESPETVAAHTTVTAKKFYRTGA